MNSFKKALDGGGVLPIVGAINAYSALLAVEAGHRAIYLSGAGVANASFGIPDLGITTLNDVATEAGRICDRVSVPLLVDIDTGFGSSLSIQRTTREMEKAGVAAVHIEDQISSKRCGHRPNKELVSTGEMTDRIKAIVDTRESLYVIARTDALANESVESVESRCVAYLEAGADAIFLEAVTNITLFKRFSDILRAPLLANMTEFGKTPMHSLVEFGEHGVSMVLYPLSAFRAMSKAALTIYQAVLNEGNLTPHLDSMQTRDELYHTLNYIAYEKELD